MLLILAGVTILTITGENEILKRATTVGEKTKEATVKEELQLLITETRIGLANEKQIINPKIDDIANYLKEKYDTEIDLTITYKKTASIIIEDNEITSDIDFAEIQFKGYKFILTKNLTIDDDKTSISELKTYTITYDANGGIGAPATQKKTEGHPLTLSTQAPTKSGYIFLGWAKDKTATEEEYKKGTSYTDDKDITLWAVWQELPTAEDVITTENYGEGVNYSANGVTDWKIFHKDDTHVYIITSDYLPVEKVPSISGISTSGMYIVNGNSRDALVNGLKNTSSWGVFVNGITGATATGTPTAELLMESYNKKYNTNLKYTDGPTIDKTDTLYVPHSSAVSECNGYYLASPNSLYTDRIWHMYFSGHIGYEIYNYTHFGIRPVVSIPSNISAIKNIDGKWTFAN